jgi:excisionase family DNA binding protein
MTGTDSYNGGELGTPDEILTVSEAAKLTGFSISTLRRWDDLGALPALRTPGNQRRYRKSELLAALYRPASD